MSHNPYESAGYVAPEPAKPGSWRMRYLEMYQYVFANPNWMMNFLWGGLCILVSGIIPLVPQMVFAGYQWDIVETLHRRRGSSYPDFNTDRIMDYLVRGLWPTLVGLVAGLLLTPLFLIYIFGGMFVIGLVGSEGGDAAAFALMFLWVIFLFVLAFGSTVFLLPLVMRAGLAQDFAQGFNFRWAMSFAKLMWKEMVLGMLFIGITSVPLAFVGLLVFCVGIYAVAVWLMFVYSHYYWQLYEIFLDRGGEPVPLKELPPPVMTGPAGWQAPQ